jgi:hypothetical protein
MQFISIVSLILPVIIIHLRNNQHQNIKICWLQSSEDSALPKVLIKCLIKYPYQIDIQLV